MKFMTDEESQPLDRWNAKKAHQVLMISPAISKVGKHAVESLRSQNLWMKHGDSGSFGIQSNETWPTFAAVSSWAPLLHAQTRVNPGSVTGFESKGKGENDTEKQD
jgi:hypothetical protein